MNRLILPALLLAGASDATAQTFNIDVGSNTTYALPAVTYGGGANQVGAWNAVPSNASNLALVHLDGTLSGVTISTDGTADFEYDNASTSGDNQKLMDDLQDVLGATTWTIDGLAAGQYEVYTYAWAPDGDAFRTNVSVQGSADGSQSIGGLWNGHVEGTTYAKHSLSVGAGGSIVINLSIGFLYGSCNGFQIVTTDENGTPFCFGTGATTSCPCANNGAAGRGCANSVVAAGAELAVAGSVNPDTLVLSASSMPPTATSIFLQGDGLATPALAFGDGLRCVDGNMKRIGLKFSVNGAAQYPEVGDLSISAQSAALGDPFGPGATRYYQTYYRDPDPSFCPGPQGNTWNVTNGAIVVW